MSVIWYVLISVGWFGCSVLTYGLSFAFFQRKYKLIADDEYDRDARFCMIGSMFGPIGLVSLIILLLLDKDGFKHGLKFR